MITIGVDAHKRLHVATALDEAGRELDQWRGPNNKAGWLAVAQWAYQLGKDRQWGIEGAWGYGRGLAQHLTLAGEIVYEVNARWTALGRRRARNPGKADRLDARAVALCVRQEAPVLPRVQPEDVTALLDFLTTEREGTLAEATRLRNQLHALLVQCDPDYRRRFRNLKSHKNLAALKSYIAPDDNAIQRERASAIRRLAVRLQLALSQVEELTKRIEETTVDAGFAPLTALCGISLLTAGALAGILGPGRRFTNDAQLAAYGGVAPLEASSAGAVRHRLNRGGNRRLNAILYRIAVTQARHSEQGRAYLSRRVTEGKTHREALRALKRYIVRAVWRLWQECGARCSTVPECTAA